MNGYLKRSGLLATAMLVCVGLTPAAQGASFDCGKAGTKVEHIICDDPELSKLDEVLNAAYKVALQDQSKASKIKREQKQWMKERSYCSDTDCMEITYRSRIDELKPNQERERFLTVLSKDKALCDAYKHYLVQETAKHGKWDYPVMCRRSFGEDYLEFSPVKWTEIEPEEHKALAVEAMHYMTNHLPWSLPWKATQKLSDSEFQKSWGWIAIGHTYKGVVMWVSEADIGNTGHPEKLLKMAKGRCNILTSKPPQWMLPVMVLDESGEHLSEKTEWMLGVSVFPAELNSRHKDMHSFRLEAFDVFSYGGSTYFDRWEDEWIYNRLGRYSSQAHQPDFAALTVYNIAQGMTSAVCRFKFNKSAK